MSLSSHASPKSRFLDVKYRKKSQSPHSRPRVNHLEKEPEEHTKPDKLVKKARKAEDRKRRKKKEEKRLAQKRKKREKAEKRERKLALKSKITEKETFTPIPTSIPPSEAKASKMEATSVCPEDRGLLPPKHKHRMRPERADRTHRAPGNTPSTSLHPAAKSGHRKMPKKNRRPPKPLGTERLLQPPPRISRPDQPGKSTAFTSSHPGDGPKSQPDDSLPSLLLKALEPLTEACSISIEQPTHGKDSSQGGALNAPDLQPEAVVGNLHELGENLANTPPVLSWQGSPVSTLGEDEEELVLIRPVLQPSPTQCFSPPPIDAESIDDLNKEPCESTPADHSHDGSAEYPAEERVVEEEKEAKKKRSGSLLCERIHHKTGLDEVFKSLATFLGSQRVPCRGGPFGGPPAGTARGVKYSSSLELGPDIHCHEDQDSPPESESDASSKPEDRAASQTTSDLQPCSPTDQREAATDAPEQEKQGDTESEGKEEDAEILAESSLSAKLKPSATLAASITSLITASAREERASSEDSQHTATDRKRKQKAKGGGREGEIKIKIKAEESSVLCSDNTVGDETSGREEKDASSSVLAASKSSPRPLIDRTKGQIPQENQISHGKEVKTDTEGPTLKLKEEDEDELEKTRSSAAGNTDLNSSSSAATKTINTSKLCVSTPASKPPSSVDPLKLKALSMGLRKELRILLIKVESAGRQTFNISEVEEQRVPLSKINILNTAAEVVRACK